MAVSTKQTLASIELFAPLPQPELEHLAAFAHARTYEPGANLFLEGEKCEGIWVVASGSVRVVKTSPLGRQVVLTVQQAPATVAEVPVFDAGPYPATVTALDAVEAFLILRADFLGVCRRNPDVALEFLAIFGRRLRHLVALVERITFGSVRQRLAQELLAFADSAGSNRFLLPEKHEDLASRLGTVREVISRNLSRFQSEGLLQIQRREIEILSREGLAREAETEY
jgi:CRP/FNR family transcriptional regulator